jgi:hypothetical protein
MAYQYFRNIVTDTFGAMSVAGRSPDTIRHFLNYFSSLTNQGARVLRKCWRHPRTRNPNSKKVGTKMIGNGR